MRADPLVFVIGEDVAEGGPYGTTAGLAYEFGRERVLNTPISEGSICGVAVGAAQSGMRPIVEIMRKSPLRLCQRMDFLQPLFKENLPFILPASEREPSPAVAEPADGFEPTTC